MQEFAATEPVTPVYPAPSKREAPARSYYVSAALLIIAFAGPFFDLVQTSLANSLYSHLPLIPFVSIYLAWQWQRDFPLPSKPLRPLALVLLAAGVATLAGYFLMRASGSAILADDRLAWLVYAFLLKFWALNAWFLGRDLLRAVAFPLGFLIFMAPFPVGLHDAMESFLQHTSADAAYFMISSAGTPILRDNLIFHLPGIVLEVAPQCSGIRSSVALFITSVVAGYLFLRSPWKRVILTFAVIPLAILRNGLRIFTIAQLCVHVSPDMVNSFIHHRGGPIFFAISLVPFFGLLYFLYRSDVRHKATSTDRTAPNSAAIGSR